MIRRIRITSLGFLLATIALAFFGIMLLTMGFSKQKKMNTYTKSTGVITKIEEEESTDGNGEKDTTHTVYVKHTVDGKEYEGQFDEYNSSFSVGKEVNLAYNPKDPSDFISANKSNLYILFIGGPVMIGAALICLLIFFVRRSRGMI